MTPEKILLTATGQTSLATELEKLRSTDRPAIIKAIAEARAHGDLSENAEYHSAKERQGFIEARLREIEAVLSRAEVFVPSSAEISAGYALFGSEVGVRDMDGKEMRFQLVSFYEANSETGLISIKSPLGMAVLGKRAGDLVEVQTPAGPVDYSIISVSHPG